MRMIIVLITLLFFSWQTLFARDFSLNAHDIIKTSLFVTMSDDLNINENTAIEWIMESLENDSFVYAVSIIQNIKNTRENLGKKEANFMLYEALKNFHIASQSAYWRVSLTSAHAGLYLSYFYFPIADKTENPYILDFLKILQKNNICSGFYQEAELITSRRFNTYVDYSGALNLLARAKDICSSPNTDEWDKKKYKSILFLLQARKKKIDGLKSRGE